MKSRGFLQTPQDIMEKYNGCSVGRYRCYRQDIHLTHGYWMGSGRVKGYTHGWIACFVRMSKPSNSVHCSEIAHEVETGNIEPDFVSALKLCKRRRIGPLRPDENRELFYKKDMGILARGGFSFDLSKRVLDLETDEFHKLVKII